MTLRSEASEKLKSYIERIERIAEERRALGDDQRALFAEAKAEGFDPKAIRKIIKRRDKDPQELAAEETILETYMHAIGMLPEHPLHQQIARLARDDMARDDVVEALQTLVPVHGEIIAKVGGDPLRIWRDEEGNAHVAAYVEPKAKPAEKTGKGLGKPAAVLSIVPKADKPADPTVTAAADRADERARRPKPFDEQLPAPARARSKCEACGADDWRETSLHSAHGGMPIIRCGECDREIEDPEAEPAE